MRSRITRTAIRVFNVALWIYPADFRHRYGESIASVFDEVCDVAYQQRGNLGVSFALVEALANVATAAAAENLSELGSMIGITNRFSLGATVAIHAVLLTILLWVGFHAPPRPPDAPDVCGQKVQPHRATSYSSVTLDRH